jgi:DNA topoisomerase IB
LVNAYLAELFDGEFTAKDFRTWHAGVIAATTLALSDESGLTQASRRRATAECYRAVAAFLGNSPTIARTSYVDPRIIDAYLAGQTVEEAAAAHYRDDEQRRTAVEEAVLQLLAEAGPA